MQPSEQPTVTVVIATYNKSRALYHALESVLWQTFADFEVWIVGDACTDDSEAVVDSFGDNRLHWYNLPSNSGYQSVPNNEGLRRARGKYIAYLNHDDLWLPRHLEVLVQRLDTQRADFGFSILKWFKGGEQIVDIPDYPHASRPPEASATMHRRDLVDEIGFWKAPAETTALPRVEYFRRAQITGKRFLLVPYLTTLKFDRSNDGYEGLSGQAEYVAQIRSEPHFAERETAELLIQATRRLEAPLSMQQLGFQMSQTIRRTMVKRGLDPGALRFWRRPGDRIQKWRKYHGLDGAAPSQ